MAETIKCRHIDAGQYKMFCDMMPCNLVYKTTGRHTKF
jgi:hypothetical protein